ncbi:MAG: hypothetical protein ACM3PO_03045, partial [Betaproteobacteria bacterium]
ISATSALAFAETNAAPMTAPMRAPTTAAPMMAQAAQAPNQAPLPVPRPANIPTKLAALKQQPSGREPSHEASRKPSHGSTPQSEYATAFLENLTSTVDSGNLFAQRQLTVTDMVDYANRNYRNARTAELIPIGSEYR